MSNITKKEVSSILLAVSVITVFCAYYFDLNEWVKVISKFMCLLIIGCKLVPNRMLKEK